MERMIRGILIAIALTVSGVSLADNLSDVQANINSQLPDNARGQITAQSLRAVLSDFATRAFNAISSLTATLTTDIQQHVGPNILNVQSFGAKCDGVTDDYTALQAAITAAADSSMPLYFPANSGHECIHSKPLVSNSVFLHLYGSSPVGYKGSTLRPTGYNGPDILIHTGPTPGFDTAPPLVGTDGVSYKYNGNFTETINIRQTRAVELDGLTDITIEGWAKSPGNFYLLSSAGGLTAHTGDILPIQSAENVSIRVLDGTASCNLNVSGTAHSLTTTAPSTSAAHYYACSWSTSTGIMDFFIDGTRVSRATSITGTIHQDTTDDLNIGCTGTGGPLAACVGSVANTLIDSVRISNNNRYGDATTMPVPTAKSTVDPNTISLINFDTDVPGFVKVYSGLNNGFWTTAYIAFFGNNEAFVIADIHDLTFNGGLWCNNCAFNSKFRNLSFIYDPVGLILAANANQDFVEDVNILKGGVQRRFGLYMTTGNGSRIANTTIDSAELPMVMHGGSPLIRDVLVVPELYTTYSFLSYEARPLIDGFYIDDEGSSGPKFVASMAFVRNWGPVSVHFMEIDSINGGSGVGKGIIFDGGYAGTLSQITTANIGSTNPTSPLVYINGNGAGMLSHPILTDNQGTDAPYIAMANANAGMTLSACGTGAFSTNAQDMDFEVTATGATACTVTFGIPFRTTPMVQCIDETTAAAIKVLPSTTAVTVSGLTSGDKFRCVVPITTGQ